MNALIVDLNNFAKYPTISVGYIVSILRAQGYAVEVFSPLALGISGVSREPSPRSLAYQWLNYRVATSTNLFARYARDAVASRFRSDLIRQSSRVTRAFRQQLVDHRPDVVLVSSYLMYYDLCERIAAICAEHHVPVILGGPYFNQPQVVNEWQGIKGLTAIYGGEVEPVLVELVHRAATSLPLDSIPGVWIPGNQSFAPAQPLADLDSIPFPDFTDFPWEYYRHPLVPVITGRGCGWGACTFCSDVTSAMGRNYRSRSIDNVISELKHQSKVYSCKDFVFTDLKLNSDPVVWHGLLDQFQKNVPAASWIGAVHVGKKNNGLSHAEIRAAKAAGAIRLTFGLESGSERVLESMAKGIDLSTVSQFLKNASDAGIGIRITMIVGYPGETAKDVLASAKFVETHASFIERISLNRFAIMTGTAIHQQLERRPNRYPGLDLLSVRHRQATIDHRYEPQKDKNYQHALKRLFIAVHGINNKTLTSGAKAFEGVM